MPTRHRTRRDVATAIPANATDPAIGATTNLNDDDDPNQQPPLPTLPNEGAGGPGEPQPEPMAEESVAGAANDDGTTKTGEKVDLKNVKISPFDGSVKQGEFDSYVKDWWEELQDQVDDAQILANQIWTDQVKVSVLKLCSRAWRVDGLDDGGPLTKHPASNRPAMLLSARFASN
ncbi:hypothetical protein PHYBOEH_006113 [Phytophthora boehmeriae]|uniref:Uncharacterized protein n=1 Tax=Phytophthora boehmeriae TaxID=109152 RepID=A0A8T1X3P3_9STRA|nr:hypothetical protein PHYBOEH_006113 [Phytophthora boehmeriae]